MPRESKNSELVVDIFLYLHAYMSNNRLGKARIKFKKFRNMYWLKDFPRVDQTEAEEHEKRLHE